MNKYVIVMADDSGAISYWNGTIMGDDQSTCLLYDSKIDARSDMAALVSSFNTSDLSVRAATVTLVIGE